VSGAVRARPPRATLLTAVAIWSVALPARAQESSELGRALFKEGRQLAAQGKYVDACPKFEQSRRLSPGIGTEFNLADCWEHLGRTASAWRSFQAVATSAHMAGQTDRESVARERASALEPKLSRLTIEDAAPPDDLRLSRDGEDQPRLLWGQAVPVDPGEHRIEATARGRQSFSARIRVPASPTSVVVHVPPLAIDVSEPAADGAQCRAPPGGSRNPAAHRAAPTRRDPASRRGVPVFGLVLTGAGVAAVVAGTVLLSDYRAKNERARTICSTGVDCTADEVSQHARLIDEARSVRTWSFLSYGVGGASLIGATLVFLTGRGHAEASSSRLAAWTAGPWLGPDGTWGAVADGRF
jgi:hypothetical protein